MSNMLYADGVTDVSVVGPNARIRFHTLTPNPDGTGKPQPTHAFTIVMPVEAVATLGESLPKLTDKLLETGRLKKVTRKASTPD